MSGSMFESIFEVFGTLMFDVVTMLEIEMWNGHAINVMTVIAGGT
jgi:hypothetical protein